MKLPVQITFRHLKSSPAVEERIHKEIAKLATFYDGLLSCRVAVELPHQHHARGNPFHLRLDLGVPGGELVVKHAPSLHSSLRKVAVERAKQQADVLAAHKDIYVALRAAFKKARRELRDYARRQRGQVKPHAGLLTARVRRLFPAKGYGFLETTDGRAVYFHQNSLANGDFAQLQPGAEVRFVEEQGEQGSQASLVKLKRKRRQVA